MRQNHLSDGTAQTRVPYIGNKRLIIRIPYPRSGPRSLGYARPGHSRDTTGRSVALVFIFILAAVLATGYLYLTGVNRDIERITSELALIRSQAAYAAGAVAPAKKAMANEPVARPETRQSISADGGQGVIANISRSLVKVLCRTQERPNDVTYGSGLLLRKSGGSGGEEDYYVQTNLHVVRPQGSTRPECAVFVYIDSSDAGTAKGFPMTSYGYLPGGIDVASLKLGIESGNPAAGTVADLASVAQREDKNRFCGAVSVGERIFILGYPTGGGATLTVTDGIISGFEKIGGTRYFKTSAKIDRGNSGGIALSHSGCLIGIPSFVAQGELESFGRILDLNNVFGGAGRPVAAGFN